MNSLVDETTAQLKELEGQVQTAETELREIVSGAEQVRQEYAQVMNWAELYDNCTFEAKKMIAAQFVKAVRVKRGYEVDVEFNVSFEEFQKLYLEPETEDTPFYSQYDYLQTYYIINSFLLELYALVI